MSRLEFSATPLRGLLVARRARMSDARGFLSRLYSASEFSAVGISKPIADINQTLTRRRGVVRGMHFQRPPHAETKVVTCIRGAVFDVAVDVRSGSPTFLRWHAEVLSEENQRSMVIPEGFAHGLQALADDCELVYLHTAAYNAAAEGGIGPTDPRLQIAWPLEITEMSDRDRGHAPIDDDFRGIAE